MTMTTDLTQKMTTKRRILMSEKNRKRRVYMKPNKPATEMTEEEISAFAKAMFDRIMGTLPEREESDEK